MSEQRTGGHSTRDGYTVTGLLRDVVIAVAFAFFFVLFLYQPVRVDGFSMQPDLGNNERLFINKIVYRIAPIHRGDVVVFWYPLDTHKSFIKRVIGLPGDRVRISNGRVYINGERLHEPYLQRSYRDHSNMPPLRVPPHEYFVLGDHRNSSSDSRIWGCVDRKLIYGKAVFAYWPPARIGVVH